MVEVGVGAAVARGGFADDDTFVELPLLELKVWFYGHSLLFAWYAKAFCIPFTLSVGFFLSVG